MATSFNGVKINRVRTENRLPEFINKVERKAARAITQAMILGGSETSVLTPIDTGTLINSRYNKVEKREGKIVGVAGYTAEYAAAVNDPDNPQNFRRPTATKDFLKKGFENAGPKIREALKGNLK